MYNFFIILVQIDHRSVLGVGEAAGRIPLPLAAWVCSSIKDKALWDTGPPAMRARSPLPYFPLA